MRVVSAAPSLYGAVPTGDTRRGYSETAAAELNVLADTVVEEDGFFRFQGTNITGPWTVDLILPADVDEERDAEMLATLRGMVRP